MSWQSRLDPTQTLHRQLARQSESTLDADNRLRTMSRFRAQGHFIQLLVVENATLFRFLILTCRSPPLTNHILVAPHRIELLGILVSFASDTKSSDSVMAYLREMSSKLVA